MITFFTTAKPFSGHSKVIQRNALASWKSLHPNAEVMLFGNEEGAAETATELGIRYVPNVKRLAQGPKLLASFFDEAQRLARNDLLCYANCDILLTRDFLHAVNVVDMIRGAFLMVGRRWSLEQLETLQPAGWEREITERAHREGKLFSGDWIDYFVFRKGFYLDQLPDFVIGRVYWDQWLVWKAKNKGAKLVDASRCVTAIHQNHDYGYQTNGKAGVWSDELSRRNYRLAGGRWHLCTIDDATHVLGPEGLNANIGHKRRVMKRLIRNAKDEVWTAALDWSRPVRRAMKVHAKSNDDS